MGALGGWAFFCERCTPFSRKPTQTNPKARPTAPHAVGRLVFKAHRLVYHSTLGLRVINKRREEEAPHAVGAIPRRKKLSLESTRARLASFLQVARHAATQPYTSRDPPSGDPRGQRPSSGWGGSYSHPLGPYSRAMPRALRWSWTGGRFLMSQVPVYTCSRGGLVLHSILTEAARGHEL